MMAKLLIAPTLLLKGEWDVQVAAKLEESLQAFNTSYLDLFLLHYPRYHKRRF